MHVSMKVNMKKSVIACFERERISHTDAARIKAISKVP